MKKGIFLFAVLILAIQLNGQNKWTVLAGGTPDASTPDPYFSPSQLTIQVGDTVVWDNIEGWHDITTTSGPEDFSYAPAGSGWTHEFVFTQAGTYNYECSVGTHALTQFGTITVVEDQTKYVIVAGGTPDASTPAPYFSPSLLTIQTGDTVVWENIEGWHDVTTTSGPEDFSYAPAGFDWTHEFVFTQVGTYDYECSVGDHALTQFGTINVEDPSVDTDDLFDNHIQSSIFPNPASNKVSVIWEQIPNANFSLELTITDIMGRNLQTVAVNPSVTQMDLDVSSMKKGVYWIALRNEQSAIWMQRLIIQ